MNSVPFGYMTGWFTSDLNDDILLSSSLRLIFPCFMSFNISLWSSRRSAGDEGLAGIVHCFVMGFSFSLCLGVSEGSAERKGEGKGKGKLGNKRDASKIKTVEYLAFSFRGDAP